MLMEVVYNQPSILWLVESLRNGSYLGIRSTRQLFVSKFPSPLSESLLLYLSESFWQESSFSSKEKGKCDVVMW